MVIFDTTHPINLNSSFVNMELQVDSYLSTDIQALWNKIWYEQQLWGNSNKLIDLDIYYIVETIFSLYAWEQYVTFDVNTFEEFIKNHNLYKVIEKLKCLGIDMYYIIKKYTEINTDK